MHVHMYKSDSLIHMHEFSLSAVWLYYSVLCVCVFFVFIASYSDLSMQHVHMHKSDSLIHMHGIANGRPFLPC